MEICYLKEELEAGIDEAGRGCLSGRVYTAAVILPLEFPDDNYLNIIDSKKLSRKKRNEMRRYIESVAIDFGVDYAEPAEIDKKNILQATLASMHRSLDKLTVLPSNIIVDGTNFKMYTDREKQAITHQLFKGGDAKYHNIAAASILAKCYHDDYVDELLDKEPELEKYGWRTNMCYGTKAHMDAIKEHGITKYHRKSFKPCCDM
jgi:ribonuclease HII